MKNSLWTWALMQRRTSTNAERLQNNAKGWFLQTILFSAGKSFRFFVANNGFTVIINPSATSFGTCFQKRNDHYHRCEWRVSRASPHRKQHNPAHASRQCGVCFPNQPYREKKVAWKDMAIVKFVASIIQFYAQIKKNYDMNTILMFSNKE